MKYTLNENTFFVKEVLAPKLTEKGYYSYYILKKKNLSHKQALKRVPRDALFSGIKDKNATTEQWFSSAQEIEDINEKDFGVEYKGKSNEKLFIGKHKENSFKALVELTKNEKSKLIGMKKELVGNFFGEQRFDVRVKEFSKLVEEEKFEEALKYFLTKESIFDSEKSTEIKKIISENWRNWKNIYENETVPESKKEIFTFLEKDNDFHGAFAFVEKKSFRQMLKAIQSQRFNIALEKLMKEKNCKRLRATKALPRQLTIEPNDFEKKYRLGSFERKTFFNAKSVQVKSTREQNKYWLKFILPKGSYATIYLRFLKEQV